MVYQTYHSEKQIDLKSVYIYSLMFETKTRVQASWISSHNHNIGTQNTTDFKCKLACMDFSSLSNTSEIIFQRDNIKLAKLVFIGTHNYY